VTNRSSPAICSLVLFYAPWCPFSAKSAPHFNALARLFPDIVIMAADANRNQGLTTQFGVLALPTVLLFHNSKAIVKFNQTDYELANFVNFVATFTGLEASADPVITEVDLVGPMPTEAIPETDIYLYMSWTFVIICALGYFGKSPFCQQIIEAIRNNWREAEIQHEHND
jgi:thiol-disulfide isomerase/thioredoxin